jgi:histidinol dehydrogenase
MKIIKADELPDNFYAYKELEEIDIVKEIINDVKQNGDQAILRWEEKLDQISLSEIKVDIKEIISAKAKITKKLKSAIIKAIYNIKRFASRQKSYFTEFVLKADIGIKLGQKVIPIERVGIYVPAGRYPLISSLLMGAVPARVAGVREVIICTPPTFQGGIHPAILYAAHLLKIKEIYKVGGAQAIAAMAYGTPSIKKVDKIVGPGNKYVTYAKKLVYGAVGIDFIAGPTEVMIIADKNANPEFIASDLLAQSEHDIDASAILITDSYELALKVKTEISKQIQTLPTKLIAESSLFNNGLIILVDNLNEAVKIANKKAPEHLELHVSNVHSYLNKFKNYGTLFIGEFSAEAFGDYSSGINHILPTNMAARYSSGLSVKDFLKLNTTLQLSKKGAAFISSTAITLAQHENLPAHANSILIRSK